MPGRAGVRRPIAAGHLSAPLRSRAPGAARRRLRPGPREKPPPCEEWLRARGFACCVGCAHPVCGPAPDSNPPPLAGNSRSPSPAPLRAAGRAATPDARRAPQEQTPPPTTCPVFAMARSLLAGRSPRCESRPDTARARPVGGRARTGLRSITVAVESRILRARLAITIVIASQSPGRFPSTGRRGDACRNPELAIDDARRSRRARPVRGLREGRARGAFHQHRARDALRPRPLRRLVRRTRRAGAARARRDHRGVRRRHGEGPRARHGAPLRGEHRRCAPRARAGKDGEERGRETRATAHAPAKGKASGAGQGAHRGAARAPARGPGRWPHRRAQPRAARGRLRHAAAPGRVGGLASHRYR